MPAVKIYGGLGNQLFQYSFAYAISKKTKEDIIIDTSFYTGAKWPVFSLDKFNIKLNNVVSFNEKNYINRQFSKIKRKLKFKNYSFYKESDAFEPKIFDDLIHNRTYYDGYFCDYRFFNDYKDELIKLYTPSFSLNEEALEILNKIKSTESVSIHFRRGDYVKIGCTIDFEYYLKAIETINKRHNNCVFFVFSDDIDFAVTTLESKMNLKNVIPVDIKSNNKDLTEFLLMKECKNHIIANSTFSWWAAYLAKDDSTICPIVGNWTERFYPETWIKINSKISKNTEKNVYWRTIYPEFYNNGLFDENKCLIGQNLMVPNIRLKESLSKESINLYTFDLYDKNIDFFVVNDLVADSKYTCSGLKEIIAYLIKKKYKRDPIKLIKRKNVKNLLLLSEPNVVCPKSYKRKYHKYFDKILTWNDDFVDNSKYFKYFIPQVKPTIKYNYPFSKKKLLVLMSSNKMSKEKGELYSKRIEVIENCLKNNIDFDLYGYGWDEKKYSCYKGKVSDKLDTISKYKFSVCFENFSCNGYITEKIFDCFFAGIIPVYYGAPNINKYIPKDLYINYNDFKSDKELFEYLNNFTEEKYNLILERINDYLDSDLFKTTFSYENYVNLLKNYINEGLK